MPAAAVIREGQALDVSTERKGFVGGLKAVFCESPEITSGRCKKNISARVYQKKVEFVKLLLKWENSARNTNGEGSFLG